MTSMRGHRVIAFRKVADRFEWSDVAVHRIHALEYDQLRAAGRCAREQFLQLREIVVAADLLGAASRTHAFDHRIVIVRIGQDQAVRKELADRRDARMVGHVARRENERRLLAMQVRKFSFQLDQSPVRARNIARSASARPHRARGSAHRSDDLRVLAHAKIVVGAPDHDIPLAARAVPERIGKLSHFALQVSEDAIAALTFQSSNGRLESPIIVEHSWVSFDWADLPSLLQRPFTGGLRRPGCSLFGGSRRQAP